MHSLKELKIWALEKASNLEYFPHTFGTPKYGEIFFMLLGDQVMYARLILFEQTRTKAILLDLNMKRWAYGFHKVCILALMFNYLEKRKHTYLEQQQQRGHVPLYDPHISLWIFHGCQITCWMRPWDFADQLASLHQIALRKPENPLVKRLTCKELIGTKDIFPCFLYFLMIFYRVLYCLRRPMGTC